jgi:hypothetical protein
VETEKRIGPLSQSSWDHGMLGGTLSGLTSTRRGWVTRWPMTGAVSSIEDSRFRIPLCHQSGHAVTCDHPRPAWGRLRACPTCPRPPANQPINIPRRKGSDKCFPAPIAKPATTRCTPGAPLLPLMSKRWTRYGQSRHREEATIDTAPTLTMMGHISVPPPSQREVTLKIW